MILRIWFSAKPLQVDIYFKTHLNEKKILEVKSITLIEDLKHSYTWKTV